MSINQIFQDFIDHDYQTIEAAIINKSCSHIHTSAQIFCRHFCRLTASHLRWRADYFMWSWTSVTRLHSRLRQEVGRGQKTSPHPHKRDENNLWAQQSGRKHDKRAQVAAGKRCQGTLWLDEEMLFKSPAERFLSCSCLSNWVTFWLDSNKFKQDSFHLFHLILFSD